MTTLLIDARIRAAAQRAASESGGDTIADFIDDALAAVEPLIRERLAQEVEAIPLGVGVEIRKQMVWAEHGGDEIRAMAARKIRGDAS